MSSAPQSYKETESMIHSKKNKSTETVPEKDLMAGLLDQDFNTTVLKMLKEVKEDVKGVKKMMCEQNGATNNEIENLKRNNNNKNLELKSTTTEVKTQQQDSEVDLIREKTESGNLKTGQWGHRG